MLLGSTGPSQDVELMHLSKYVLQMMLWISEGSDIELDSNASMMDDEE